MYDPMVAKLIVWDADREQATQRMLRALGEYEIEGLKTLIPFHQALLATEQWARGETCRDLLEDKKWLKTLAFPAAAAPARRGGRPRRSSRPTRSRSRAGASTCACVGPPFAGRRRRGRQRRRAAPARSAPQRSERKAAQRAAVPTRCPRRCRETCGRCSSSRATPSQEGQLLCIIEAMKMENEITAHKAGTIVELPIAEGAPIQAGAPIATIKSAPRRARPRPAAVAALSRCMARCSRRAAPPSGSSAALAARAAASRR